MTALPLPLRASASAQQRRTAGRQPGVKPRLKLVVAVWHFAGRIALVLLVEAALLVAAAVAVSHTLGLQYAAADTASPLLAPGTLGVFGPVEPGALRRGDVVRFTSPATGQPSIRVISAFTADGSAAVTRPSDSLPADPGTVAAVLIDQRLRFSLPLAGYATAWLGEHVDTEMLANGEVASLTPQLPIGVANGLVSLWVAVAVATALLLLIVALLAIRDRRNPTRRRTQPRLRNIRLVPRSLHAGVPAETMWDGIVTRIQSDDESYQVRFPLRRQRPQEFSTTDPAGDSVAQGAVVATEDKAAEFEPPLGAGTPEGTRPETPALAAVRDPLPFPRPPAPPSAPPPRLRAEAGPPAHEAPPSLPVAPLASSLFTVPLRGQASASDARADRLVRQVRGEIEQLRQSFQALSTEHGEMLHVDPADIAANPEAALALPPAVLVRTILAVHACNAESEMRRKRQAKRLAKLQARLRKFAIEDAETRGRLGTLEEVISALHANLEDLRLERGSAPRVLTTPGLPSLPQPLLARQHESSAPELGRQNSELRTQNSEPSPGNGQDA